MAVEIPVVIDIEGAFADAAKRVPAAMRPLAQSIEGLTNEMNKWQDKVNRYKIDGPQWKNAVNHVQALSHALEIASDRFMYFSTNEGSLRRLNGELAITVREWEKMGAAQKFDKTGQLTAEAQQLYQKYKDITQAIRESGKTLQQMEAEEKKILSLKAQGQQSRRYENAILNTTVKTMRVLSEQERILSARLQSTPVGSQKFIDLSARLKQVRNDMALAEAQVRRGGAAYRDLGAGAATATTQIRGTSAALSTQGGILKRLSGYLSGYMLLFAGIRFIKNVRETTAELELQKVALASIVQNADLANDLFRQIKAAALKSPFEIKDLVTYTKQLAAYRIENDKLFDVTMRLADVSAGLGVDMNRLVLAYGQVRAAAVLRGQELRQFTEAGIPLVDLLAKKFQQLGREGTTTADVFELISKRAVSFSMIEEIFNDMTSAGGEFYKMQEKQSETLKGQWMKLKDSITIMYDEIGNTATVHNAMSSFIKSANNLARSWREVGNWIKTLTAAIITYNLVAKASVLATNSITKSEAMRLAVTKSQAIAMPKVIAAIIGETAAKKASAVASRALEISQYRLATATTLTGKAFWGLNAAIMANPYAAALAGLAALGLGIYTLVKNSREAAITVDELEASISRFQNASEKMMETDKLIDAYEKLINKADRTTDEQERLDRMTKELAKTFPSAVSGIDKESGALQINIEKVKELTKAEQELELARLKRDENRAKKRVEELKDEQQAILDAFKRGGYVPEYASASYSSKEFGQFVPFSEDQKAEMGQRLREIKDEMDPLIKNLERIETLQNAITEDDGGKTTKLFKGWKQALKDLQDEKVKAGATTIFTDEDIEKMSDIYDLWKKTKSGIKEAQQNLEGLQSLQKTLAEDKKAENQASIDLAKKEVDLWESIVKLFGFVFKSGGSGGGYHQDPFINKMQERIKFMQDFEKGYKKLSEYMTGESALDKQFAIMEKRGMSLGLDATEQKRAANELSKWYEDMRTAAFAEVQKKFGVEGSIDDFLRQEIIDTSNKGKALKDFQKLIQSLWDAQTDLDTSEFEREMKEALERVTENIKRSEAARDFYNNILGLTGDDDLATTMSVSVYGDIGKDFKNRMQEQLDAAFQSLDWTTMPSALWGELNIAFSEQDFDTILKHLELFPEEWRKVIKRMADDSEKHSAELMKNFADLIAKYGDTAQKIATIRAKADNEIKKVKDALDESLTDVSLTPEQKKALESRAAEIIKALEANRDLDKFKQSDDYIKFFAEINVMTAEQAAKVRGELRNAYLKAFQEGAISADELRKNLRAIDEQFKKLSESTTLFGAYLNGGIDAANKKLQEYSANVSVLAAKMKAGKELDGAEQEFASKMLKMFGSGNTEGIESYEQLIGAFSDSGGLKAAGEAFGEMGEGMSAMAANGPGALAIVDAIIKAVNSTIVGIQQIIDQLNEVRGEDKKIGKWFRFLGDFNKYAFSGWEKLKSGDVIGAFVDTISSIISIFNNIQRVKIDKINKEIEEQADLVKDLEYSYSRLEKVIAESFGSEYIYNYNKQLEILKAKAEAYQKQADLERSKGKSADEEVAKGYEESARDIQDQISDMQGQLKEFFAGTDLYSAAEDFANAWIEAYKEFGSTTDAMSEKFNDMINSMINRSLAAKIMQEMLQPVFDQIDTMARDGLLSTEEIGSIASLAQERIPMINDAMTNLMASLAAAGLDVRTSTAGFKGISKSIAGASEESILGLAAAVNTQNFYMSYVPIINENVAAILSAMTGGAVTGSGVNLETTENGEVMPSVQKMIYDHLPLMDQNLAELLRLVRSVITTKNGSTNTNYVAVK